MSLLVGDAVALATINAGRSGDPSADELAGVAAGARTEPTPAATPPSTTPATASPPAAGPLRRSRPSSGQATTTTTAPAPPPTTPTTPPADYQYVFTLDPLCAVVGQEFTATFAEVEPGSAVGLTVAYADGSFDSVTFWAGNAGPDGRAVHKWKVPPVPGWGQLIHAVTTPDGRKGGNFVYFEIIEPGGTCSE